MPSARPLQHGVLTLLAKCTRAHSAINAIPTGLGATLVDDQPGRANVQTDRVERCREQHPPPGKRTDEPNEHADPLEPSSRRPTEPTSRRTLGANAERAPDRADEQEDPRSQWSASIQALAGKDRGSASSSTSAPDGDASLGGSRKVLSLRRRTSRAARTPMPAAATAGIISCARDRLSTASLGSSRRGRYRATCRVVWCYGRRRHLASRWARRRSRVRGGATRCGGSGPSFDWRLASRLQFGDHGLAVGLTSGQLHDQADEELSELLVTFAVARPFVGVGFDQRRDRCAERV